MEELITKFLELKQAKEMIESEILSEKRSIKHKVNKLKLAKDFLKLIDDEIKENEQKLKKLLN